MSKSHILVWLPAVAGAAALSILSTSSAARAQSAAPPALAGQASGGASCPPGSWFCAQAPQQQAAAAGQPVDPLEPLPQPESPPPKRRTRPTVTAVAEPPPPVVYEPPPVGQVERGETPPPYEFAPPPHPPVSPPHEWGLNLHLEGATVGRGTQGDAAMGGFGGGLRFKPTRSFGIQGDLDFVSGRDYQGDNRHETAFTLNGLIFLNPRSHVQVYLLAGFGWSSAHVVSDTQSLDTNYAYFGGQAGLGLELRLSRVLAFNADFRGFIRGRTDSGAQSRPEFTDAYGRTSNSSGGGLFTGGMTLYF